MTMRNQDILSKIDFSNAQLYKVTDADCENLAFRAKVYGFDAILVCPSSLPFVHPILEGTPVKIKVALSYPSGTYEPYTKGQEIEELEARYNCIDEYVFVAGVGKIMSGLYAEADEEMRLIRRYAGEKPVWGIVEAHMLSLEAMKKYCELARKNGLKGVFTSTGFKEYDIPEPTLEEIGAFCGIAAKYALEVCACGDYADRERLEKLLEAGVSRICTYHVKAMQQELDV